MTRYLIQSNYSTVIVVIFMIIFLNTNNFFDKKIINYFKIVTLTILVITIADSIEYWTASLAYPTTLRIWVSAIGYTLRTAVIFFLIFIVTRKQNIKDILLSLPLLANAIISFSALFCGISFSYTSTNIFVRGPLGYTPFIVAVFYLVMLVIYTINTYRNQNSMEPLIAIAAAVFNTVAMIYESKTGQDGIINSTAAISIVFYYLYLNTQEFKRDPLTNVFNRRCFFIDAEKHKNSLSAVISIDLNNLKNINDTHSHQEGDIAICRMVKCILKVLDKGCFLYRVGGDEFIILCFQKKKETVKQLIYKIQSEMKKTPYSCAIGFSFLDDNINFKDACRIADLDMYNNKQQQKKLIKLFS